MKTSHFISKSPASFVAAAVFAVLQCEPCDGQVQTTGEPARTSLPTSANGGDIGSGQLNFQADLFTGAFTYTVPIAVPPARQNSQPKIALRYNSSQGNSWCGVGWELELGRIERETRYGIPVYWTNGVFAQYDDTKSFNVNFEGITGQLVRVSPTGQSPAEYRLKVDKSFLRFLYYNQVSNAYWTVISKDGTQYFFGEGPTNRLDNSYFSGGYGTNTIRWALDRIRDPNGNESYITYTNYFNLQLYPLELSYNANINTPALPASHTVDFLLTNRTDPFSNCKFDTTLYTSLLLSQIIVKAPGQKVRRYALNYTNSPSTLRSLLASVVEYGSDDTSSLPPLTFTYQVKPFGFGPLQDWGGLNSQGSSSPDWNSVNAAITNGQTYVRFIDIDGDGLPDRVMRNAGSPYNVFVVQRNTGSGFETTNYVWGGLDDQGLTNSAPWGGISLSTNKVAGGTNYIAVDLFDINGDGRPDRVMTNFQSTASWRVQLNTGAPGSNSFAPAVTWGGLATGKPNIRSESGNSGGYDWADQEMVDVNGDGLPDRLFGASSLAQYNAGTNFGPLVGYGILNTFYVLGNLGANATPPYLSQYSNGKTALSLLVDINGDGLPDSVQPGKNNSTNVYGVGYGTFTGPVPQQGHNWTPLLSEGFTNQNNGAWNGCDYWVDESKNATGNMVQMVALIDINGDGLPDRVLTKAFSPFDRFKVQLNTGDGFGPLIDWTNVQSEFNQTHNNTNQAWNSINYVTNGQTVVTLVDIDGDGLPDRVMRKLNSPYSSLKVQLNLGPFPDLLCKVDNGLGGKVTTTYLPSTKYDNTDRLWTNSPWASGAKSLLPFPLYTVSTITVDDGMGNLATNTYAYQHGMFDPVSRELRGFNCATVTDPYGGKTVTYFHQSGGFDNSSNGEYQDQGSFSKKGMPYRVELWGTNGLLYQVALSKVAETVLNTNGWYFPYVVQTIQMNYEGLSTYRATATQFSYDTNTENLVAQADFGEVTNIVVQGQTFTDVGSDSVYKWISYSSIGNILSRPSDVKITSDSAGANRLRESQFLYDSNGNLRTNLAWLDTAGGFITVATDAYDQYGNLIQATDASGVTTANTYDSTYQEYPVTQNTAGFSSQASYDVRSGLALTATDAKGLVSSNTYDVFFRPTGTYISTNAYGSATLWQTRSFYTLGGITNSVSYNIVHKQVNDAVDPINGYETYTYADGIGRTIEVRAEAETGQFRTANTVFDLHGKPCFQTLPYFSSGSSYTIPSTTYLGSMTEYDSIGRPFRDTPAVNGAFNSSGQLQSLTATGGDTGSPVGPTTVVFSDSGNQWGTVITDSEGKVKKYYRDAYGRTVMVTQVASSGNCNTIYIYDLLGNLTNVTDTANNVITISYDSLGRKKSMNDPDMGFWSYVYDNAGRLVQQTDARTNTVVFSYSDPLGRISSKQIYNSTGNPVASVSYMYDSSDDPNYTVYKGQLYKVTDRQGYERNSYDVRGRVLKTGRFLNLNSMEYTVQATYDDADRVQQLTYPGNAATVQYSYDTAGHTSMVKSLSGTGTQETFYTPGNFNALDQLTAYTNGNGVVTLNSYFANSTRLQRLQAFSGSTNLQDHSYTYDTVSDLKSLSDAVYTGGASASLSGIVYDDLYRVTSLTSTALGTKTYGYNSIGNLLTNQDFGSGQYQYGAKPHAVISANGMNYSYDACGNMTNRGGQTLKYDEENQLIQVSGTNTSVTFGYGDDGERLWRCGTNGYSIWVGGLYEINKGKVLCHVFAEGQRVATFEPQCTAGLSKVIGEERWFVASTALDVALAWPFQKGRSQITILCAMWLAISTIWLLASRGTKRGRRLAAHKLRRGCLWKRAVTFASISAMIIATADDAEAVTYNPVFYYYHPDRLGSSNIATDRSGNLVQHYEYATFGMTSYSANSSAFPVSNRYTDQIADDETGLYYYGARYYDPQLGRFIQADPSVPDAGDSQSFNRYSYVRNNPLNSIDPSGFDDTGGDGTGGFSFGDTGSDNFGDFGGILTFADYSFSYDYTPFYTASTLSVSGVTWTGDTLTYNYASVSWDGGSITEQQTTLTTPDRIYDGVFIHGMTFSSTSVFVSTSSPEPAAAPPPTPTPAPPPAAASSGGGWLSALTTAAGLLSVIPGPVGIVAGIVNGVGEALQGHWGSVALALGGAALATVGLGIVTELGAAAREAKAAAAAAKEAAAAAKIADEALVVRGGKNLAEDVARGIGTHPSGVVGFSVESAAGKSLEELSSAIPHGQVGVTTVGKIRAVGGDVIRTSGRSPYHATVTGLEVNEASSLLRPTIPNPSKVKVK